MYVCIWVWYHIFVYMPMYKCVFRHFGFFFSSGRGSFLVFSAPWHAGSPREHWVQVWALAKVRGTRSGGSKSRKLVNSHGIDFRPVRANQAHANPKNKTRFAPHVIFSFSRSPPYVIFSFFVSGYCCYGTTAGLQAFPFMTAVNGASACGLVSMRAFARGVNSVILLSAHLYTRTWLTMATT